VQSVLGQCGGGDVKAALDDVLNALRQRFPATAEVSVEHLDEFSGRDMPDVLVCQVGYPEDGTLLDGDALLGAVVNADNAGLKAACLIFLDHLRLVYLDFLEFESTLDNICVSTHVVFQVGVSFRAFPHPEHVIFLDIPYVTLGQRFKCYRFFLFHHTAFICCKSNYKFVIHKLFTSFF